jgi:flagellar motor switch protein FliG
MTVELLSPSQLTGRQRAAAILVQMGPERALRVLRHMSQVEVVDLMAGVAELPTLNEDVTNEVVGNFIEETKAARQIPQGGMSMARELLNGLLGSRQAETVMASLAGATHNPLAFLNEVEAHQVAAFLTDEHSQTIAVILAHLPPTLAAEVLAELPNAMRPEVARRIATLTPVAPDVLASTAELVRRKLAALLGSATVGDGRGLETLVSILSNCDRSTERSVVGELEATDADLAERVKARLFTFDDVLNLDDRTVQRILRNLPTTDLAVALKGVDAQLRAKFAKNMSERAASDLADEIDLLGPTRMSTIETAQSEVVRTIRELEAAGEIMLSRGSDDDPVV